MKFSFSLLFSMMLLCSAFTATANSIEISPKNWWQNMNLNHITVIAENVPLGLRNISINYPGVTLTSFSAAQNNTFYYLDLEISETAKVGAIPITFHFVNNKRRSSIFYLYQRTPQTEPEKLSAEDVIYQIIPDRFCDSQPGNNQIKHYFERSDRLNPGGLHGGDLNGITQNIPYITELACTSIELTPVLESNLMTHSYDRMAPTNHYKIDERLGGNADYLSLVEECIKNNIKCIQTFVLHQIGKQHPWYKKMIDPDFFYQSLYNYDDEPLNLNVLLDPYTTEKHKTNHRKTWELPNWPTLNQNNIIVQKALIQHCIWWMETSGVRIIKIEQAARNTPSFLTTFSEAIKSEYPTMNLIFDTKSIYNTQRQLNTLEAPNYYTDYTYPLLLSNVFSTYRDNNEGVTELYDYAAKQDIKADLQSKLICLDNHNLTRAFTNADSESDQLLLMLAHLLTSPGIPRISYGTEWQSKGNYNKGESAVRKDFPGGWINDQKNGFNQEQMSSDKVDFFRQVQAILSWRKNNPEVLKGDFKHYYPKNDIYTYARTSEKGAILVLINNSDQNKHQLNATNYEEILSKYSWGKDIITGDRYMDYNEIITEAKSITMLELFE